MVTKIEANNKGKEKKDYIREALEYTGKELSQLQRASFIEKVSSNKWNYRLDTVKTYLDGIKNDMSYLNLSKNKNTTVMATQIALFKAWYMWVGHIDAKWWPYTMSCIRKFQMENGLPVSGYLTRRTVDKLLTVAAEKQGWAPETKEQKKQEAKKQDTKPKNPTPSKKATTPDTKKPDAPTPQIDKKKEKTEALSQRDSAEIRRAIREVGWFDMYHEFVLKNWKEVTKGNKKYLTILWTEYEQYPSEWLSSPENETSKNWYQIWPDYFMFWKFIDNRCYDGVKVSWWGCIIEKWSFDINWDLEEHNPNSKREFLDAKIKEIFENPTPTPEQYNGYEKQSS